MVVLNLIFLEKDNTAYAVLINAAMCLNLIGEPKVHHLINCT
jgi:hypothetical protein